MTEQQLNAKPGTLHEWKNAMKIFDRMEVPSGPWNNEPTKMQWVDAATDLPCLIVRSLTGALCGYVGVSESHPWHGQDYDNVSADVHGGLTFAAGCQHPDDESTGICHIPEPGTPDNVWWFGFDCSHLGDLAPYQLAINSLLSRSGGDRFGHFGETYKDVPYVAKQVELLAAQLRQAAIKE